jgi:hypothetical protein
LREVRSLERAALHGDRAMGRWRHAGLAPALVKVTALAKVSARQQADPIAPEAVVAFARMHWARVQRARAQTLSVRPETC